MKTSAEIPAQPELFNLSIQGGSLEEILTWCFADTSTNQKWIVTANPEILLEAKRNPAYAAVIRQADYLSVDGIGLFIALRILQYAVTRVTGVALAERLIERAAQDGLRVGFVGGGPGVADRVGAYWKERYPALDVVSEEGGTIQPDGTGDLAEEEALHRLVLKAPDVLFVAFGGGTKQESWIARRIGDIPSVKIIVGIGGAFDFWVGRIKRAPKWLQSLGLEWFWRLLQEPRRIKRIARATIIFPLIFVFDQLRRPGLGRRRVLYVCTLVIRVLFFLFILCPAFYLSVRFIVFKGVFQYSWKLADLTIPFVIFVVLYPVVRFLRHLFDKPPSVE